MSERFNGEDEATEFMQRVEKLIEGDPKLSTYKLWDELREKLNRAYHRGWYDRERRINE